MLHVVSKSHFKDTKSMRERDYVAKMTRTFEQFDCTRVPIHFRFYENK